MIPENLAPVANHLWQSTGFAAAAMAAAWLLRRNGAQARYRIWMAASLKFLIPFSLLVGLGSKVDLPQAAAVAPPVTRAIEQVSQPFRAVRVSVQTVSGDTAVAWPAVAGAIWAAGFFAVSAMWWVRWRRVRAAIRAAVPAPVTAPVPVVSTASAIEPGVFGFVRPVLVLPEGIVSRLTPAQLAAIVAHEMAHVRRRDNLAAAVHMLVEAVFWFHPLVWWIGARLVEERERACDEDVLRLGNQPRDYAEGILNVCKYYAGSRLPCAAGVTGSDLKKRIEAIMLNRHSLQLTRARKLLLAAAALAVVCGPVAIGVLRGQETEKFEVASVKPTPPGAEGVRIMFGPGGTLNVNNAGLRELVTIAYRVRHFQVTGGPKWMESERFDIIAKPPEQAAQAEPPGPLTPDRREAFERKMRERLQNLLAERFQLQVHQESKEMPVYDLVLNRGGHKLKPAEQPGGRMRIGRGQFEATGVEIGGIVQALSNMSGRKVIDKTGITGHYDFTLQWAPEPGLGGGPFGGPPAGGPGGPGGAAPSADPGGPSLFTAIQEQLGLRLENSRGPVEIIVIDRAEKPSAN